MGRGSTGSANFQINSTLGQPSLPTGPADHPVAHLRPVDRILVAPPFSACPADFEPDGDVDKGDLFVLGTGFGQSGLSADADEDKDMDGLSDWGQENYSI